MQQVLFHIPFTSIPLYGFGAMLFLTFVIVAMWWGPRRCELVGVPRDRLQDLAITLFLTGIAGARILYMVQYQDQFSAKTPLEWVTAFFQIWNGGIVFYGSVFGGLLGYLVFYRLVLKKLNVSTAKLADAVAPLMAIGMAVGRIGCYLNGCCWGQPVAPECQPVPLSAALGQFPLLPAHARDQVCLPPKDTSRLPQIHGLQTSTGFAGPTRLPFGVGDPRTVVLVEPGSQAGAAGIQPGDVIVEVLGKPNLIVVELAGSTEVAAAAVEKLKSLGGTKVEFPAVEEKDRTSTRIGFDSAETYRTAAAALVVLREQGLIASAHDTLWELARDWPRGQNELPLVVERAGVKTPIAYTPRTVPFFPTQLYETVSMLLLTFLLLSFQPFRRHDGQVMVLLMLGYSVHRFFNEAIRIEPTYAMGLTLSQWISVLIFTAGVVLEVYLRATQPKLPAGEVPLNYGVPPIAPKPA